MVSSYSLSSASDDDEPLLKKLCVLLCMLQTYNAPKFPGGAYPQTALEWRPSEVPMFYFTSASNLAAWCHFAY